MIIRIMAITILLGAVSLVFAFGSFGYFAIDEYSNQVTQVHLQRS